MDYTDQDYAPKRRGIEPRIRYRIIIGPDGSRQYRVPRQRDLELARALADVTISKGGRLLTPGIEGD